MTLIVEVDAIRTMGNDLKSVASEFDGANANSDSIAAAVGHHRLSEVVHDFAHGWDDTRAKMQLEILERERGASKHKVTPQIGPVGA